MTKGDEGAGPGDTSLARREEQPTQSLRNARQGESAYNCL